MQAEVEATDMSAQDSKVDQEGAQDEGEQKPAESHPSEVDPIEEQQHDGTAAGNDEGGDSPATAEEEPSDPPGIDGEASSAGPISREVDHDHAAATKIQQRARGMNERKRVAGMKQQGQLPGQKRLNKVRSAFVVSGTMCHWNAVIAHITRMYMCVCVYIFMHT